VLAPNSGDHEVDERGYWAVEWWVLSLVAAENEVPKNNEGLTEIILGEQESDTVTLVAVADAAESKVFGEFRRSWPLTKVLDIGGNAVPPSFCPDRPEVPPIPCHVHSGQIEKDASGQLKLRGPGKLEAYFFPPLNVAPYNMEIKCQTRLGLKPSTTKEQVTAALTKFGVDDECYTLLNVYDVEAYDGWTIPTGVVHSPGPYPTFEIQRPQDDFNLLSWGLGCRCTQSSLPHMKNTLQLKGLPDETNFVELLLDWPKNVDSSFRESNYRPSTTLSEGVWGRQRRIFFDLFYGEAFEVAAGQEFKRDEDRRPLGGIVWSGQGTLNGNPVSADTPLSREFLVVPHTPIILSNTGQGVLHVFVVFPMQE